MSKENNCNCEKEFEEMMKKKFGADFEKKIEKKFENWGNCDNWHENKSSSFMGGGFYFLFFIGTAVYYISQSTTFWIGALGVLKALVWPAMLAYEIFSRLNM